MLIHHVEPSMQEVAAAGRRAPAYAWLVFGLTVGLLLSDYMSRQVLNAIFPLLKHAWGLSDTQLGSLSGVVALLVGLLTFPSRVILNVPVPEKVVKTSRSPALLSVNVLFKTLSPETLLPVISSTKPSSLFMFAVLPENSPVTSIGSVVSSEVSSNRSMVRKNPKSWFPSAVLP